MLVVGIVLGHEEQPRAAYMRDVSQAVTVLLFLPSRGCFGAQKRMCSKPISGPSTRAIPMVGWGSRRLSVGLPGLNS